MFRYSIKQISEIVGGVIFGNSNQEINNIVIDSRILISPEDSVFFAINGQNHNGHDYIPEAYRRGVRCYVITQNSNQLSSLNGATFIKVENSREALQKLSAFHRSQYNIPVIGITGSNGKTIIKEWLFQLLQNDYNIIRSPKSYNSQVGVPLSVWGIEDSHNLGIFEAGISQIDEMSRLEPIIKPTIGLFTNIGDAHQKNFIDYKHKINEKLKLFSNVEKLIYCKDYPHIEMQIQANYKLDESKLFSWSTNLPANLFIRKIEKRDDSSLIIGKILNREYLLEVPFIDGASIENCIHCWALLYQFSIPFEIIQDRMKSLNPVAMRLELKKGINNCTIINDSYNSDLGSLSIALDYLHRQNQHSSRTLILSDILQSGRNDLSLYKDVAELIKNKQVTRLIGIGEAISKNKNLFDVSSVFYDTTEEFLNDMSKDGFSNEAILIKGSRLFRFEKISNFLQQKNHRTVLEIDLDAMTNNLNIFRKKISQKTKVMAMVKAYAYGAGSYEIANLLQYHRVDYLAVAYADEGFFLRQNGITLPIMVMNPDSESYESMISHNLEPEIYSFESLDLFCKAASKYSVKSFPIHIKIDTGMKRLGFLEQDIPRLIDRLKKIQSIRIMSVFSHLAAADEDVHDEFTLNQITLFDKLSAEICSVFKYKILRHILNSSGIERFSDAQFDMVRLGIGLFGVGDDNALENVSTLKTQISQVKTIRVGETVGYSRKGISDKESKIAIIPIGYADGLSRRLSNGKGKLFVNGKFIKVIGNICMDMTMLDISEVNAKEGDEVIVFGKEYNIEDFAKSLETIPYDILTSVSGRVKRVYFQGGS